MKKTHPNTSAFCLLPSAFTLVELMIVMGVIVIMMAMLFPVVTGSKDKTRKKQAVTEAHNIVLAISAYRSEFGKWPNQSQAGMDKTYFADNYKVIQQLVGNNARGKVFLAIQASNQTDSITNMVDPWGVPYVICMDENDDTHCVINFKDVAYTNNFLNPPAIKSYSATNYWVSNQMVAVASFANRTNVTLASPFTVETWSEAR
jgi:prepilin-type N-terminal cleavage/methylation domain-containing protein